MLRQIPARSLGLCLDLTAVATLNLVKQLWLSRPEVGLRTKLNLISSCCRLVFHTRDRLHLLWPVSQQLGADSLCSATSGCASDSYNHWRGLRSRLELQSHFRVLHEFCGWLGHSECGNDCIDF